MSNKAVLAIGTIKDFDWKNAEISESRRKKADSYRFEDDKKRCVLSEILLRKALFAFGLNPKEILYKFNEHEKPFLKDYSDVFFSISHSKDYALCIVSDSEIGIDIEHIEDINLNIAKRFFTEPEYEAIVSLENDKDKLIKFYDCWTKKEAYIKWAGKGLSCSLNSFNVYDKLDCEFVSLNSFEDYKCAICTREKITNLEVI